MDPLVELPLQRWPEIRELFKDQRPDKIPAFYALDTHLRNKDLVAEFNTKVYSPYGDINHGAVILIDAEEIVKVIILINGKRTEKLEEALINTKFIDIEKMICIPWADLDVITFVEKIQSEIGWVEKFITTTEKYIKYKDSECYPNLRCPPNTYTGAVQLKHVPRVAETWPHTNRFAKQYFQKLLLADLSYGLFSKEDDSLVAWIFISEVGYLTHLYCEESHRRRGYAEFVARWVTNDQLVKGNHVFCYIVEGNIASMQLYKKLGYEVAGRADWRFYEKQNVNICKKNALNKDFI